MTATSLVDVEVDGRAACLIAKVVDAISKAEEGRSCLSPDVLAIHGMSSPKVRHFLSNVVQHANRYLELGCHRGSTLISALYGGLVPATAIDNFSQFGGPREEFLRNVDALIPDHPLTFLDGDCFSSEIMARVPSGTDVYFYDASHSILDQWRALQLYLSKLSDPCIYICDDWNGSDVQCAWRELCKSGLFTVRKQWELGARFNGDCSMEPVGGWWNGLLVAVISKPVDAIW